MVRGSYRGQDGLSSVRLVVDEDGDVVASYDADEFGANPTASGSMTSVTDQRWLGGLGLKNEVGQTGLYYVRQRFYDPDTGRFLSRDPIGSTAGLNLYSYGDNSPVNRVDPTGLDTLLIFSGPTTGNPIGHVGIAIEGKGVYSFRTQDKSMGTKCELGTDVFNYINRYTAKDRWVQILRIKTTPEQEAKMIEAAFKEKDKIWGYNGYTCGTYVTEMLDAGQVFEKDGMVSPNDPDNPRNIFNTAKQLSTNISHVQIKGGTKVESSNTNYSWLSDFNRR